MIKLLIFNMFKGYSLKNNKQYLMVRFFSCGTKFKVQKLYLKTIHSNTNNTSSIELLNRLSNKHKIVIENMHDDDSGQYI